MTSTLRRGVTPAAAAVLATATLIGLGAPSAGADTTPPWEPDSNSVGTVQFFDSNGDPITGGSINDPVAPYVEGTAAVRAGDTNAVLAGYLPVKNELPSEWNGEFLSGSTSYPNSAAPGTLKTASLPVVTTVPTDVTIAQLITDFPTTSDAGYANVYQLRLTTTAPNMQGNPAYDSIDISVNPDAGTWSTDTTAAPTSTTTALAVSPSKPVYGAKVTLSATVSPAVAGSVKFLDGTKVLHTVGVTSGTASYSTTTLSGGSHKLKATFVPTDTQTYAGSSSTVHTVTVSAESTATTLKASKTTLKHGAKLTLSAAEKPAAAGSVTFYDGTKKLGSVTVKSGAASLSTTKLTVGSHKLKATFTPSSTANYSKSTSKTLTVKVTK